MRESEQEKERVREGGIEGGREGQTDRQKEAYVSIRQHTSAYISIRQHTSERGTDRREHTQYIRRELKHVVALTKR
jgi:hypothetical protein